MNIRITLADGTRTQIPAEDVESVEPQGRGTLIHLNSGDALSVAQDVRVVNLRIEAALAQQARDPEVPSQTATMRRPLTAADRVKRYLAGRPSFGALMIASAWRS